MRSRVTTPGMMAMALTAFIAVGCNRAPNTEDQVEKGLKDANIHDVDVDYDSGNKVVHLKGAVDSATESSRAEDIANRVVGTSGRVANEITVKGAATDRADDMDGAIRRELNAKVANDKMLEGRDINFDVNNGVVTIKGEVKTDIEKSSVNEMAKSTANVRDVVNALAIDSTLAPTHPMGAPGMPQERAPR